jgi:hypothetical protein
VETNSPFSRGACIQLLLAMIQNAESVVPSATIAVEKANDGLAAETAVAKRFGRLCSSTVERMRAVRVPFASMRKG